MTFKRLILSQFVLALSLGGTALADDAAVPTAAGLENAWKPQAGDAIRFNVLRKGNEFGSHTVTFEAGPNNALIAKTKVDLKAGLGPITVFRYDLAASETWRGGELVAVSGQGNDDGKKNSMKATRDGDALEIQGSEFTGEVPADIIPASHWNYAQTKASELLSTENGEIYKVTVTPKGRETIQAGGKSIEANRYFMDSNIDVDVWYDDQGRWVKLAFEARGQEIEYVLDQMY